MSQCDPEEAESIKNAQIVIARPNIKKDLAFIKCNFEYLSVSLTKIQKQNALLTEAIDTFKSVRPKLEKITARPEFKKKFDDVVAKNKALATLQEIALVLNGNSTSRINTSTVCAELEAFKYAPVVSCDVE